MQIPRSAVAPLLLFFLAAAAGFAAPAKTHTVLLGAARKVGYAPVGAAAGTEMSTLKVRPLIVDGRQRDWTVGEAHDVTDRSFTVRRVLRVNDSLPGETPMRWRWQPGPWLLVDRATGHIAPLHLADFDAAVSEAVWYRDYAAYCGPTATGKTLDAVVAQIGVRKAVVLRELAKWSPTGQAGPACAPARWQRQPMRVTFQPVGGAAVSFEVVGGASALIEDGDNSDEP